MLAGGSCASHLGGAPRQCRSGYRCLSQLRCTRACVDLRALVCMWCTAPSRRGASGYASMVQLVCTTLLASSCALSRLLALGGNLQL